MEIENLKRAVRTLTLFSIELVLVFIGRVTDNTQCQISEGNVRLLKASLSNIIHICIFCTFATYSFLIAIN